MTRFSIITVVRNDAVGVVKTLQSVFAQTHANYEVIVQDGASTDGTSAILYGFGDWIDSLVVERDAGIYDAMNRALARASGDWVLFLNAADYFVNDLVLQTVAAALRDDDDILVGQPIRDEDGKVHQYQPRDRFWVGSINDHQASFVRRELAQRLAFNPRFKVAGDLDFFLRARDLGARDRFVPIPIVRKPFGVGASSGFMDRLRERGPLLLGKFEGQYPVRETLREQLATYVRTEFAVDPAMIHDWSYETLAAAVTRWNERLEKQPGTP